MIALLSTVYTSKTLRAAIVRLSDSEDRLRSVNADAQETIDEWYGAQEEFLIKSARLSQPSREGAYSKAEFKRVFSRFIKNPYYIDQLPIQVGSAHYRLGQLRSMEGNNQVAIKLLQKSISIAEQHDSIELLALSKNTLGCVYAQLGEYSSALHQISSSVKLLSQTPAQNIMLSIAYRNMGLLDQTVDRDGIASIQQAIHLLKTETADGGLSLPRELLIDSQMTLCQMLWSKGKRSEAIQACDEARQNLATLLEEIQDASIDTNTAALNRYRNAIHFTDRNRTALGSGASSDAWQWQRLVNLVTEIVPDDLLVTATMVAEFEQQSGLVLAWGMYDWTHEVIAEIVRLVHHRMRVVVLVDNDDSLDEAQTTFSALGIPLDRIRFGVSNFESPWFRDVGPIVGRSPTGDWIWFDSQLTRESNAYREVTDSLPRLFCRNWAARVASTSLHIEGGAILCNGNGLTLCSTAVIDDNQSYGFDQATVLRELRRITGAKTVIPIQPLQGEPTRHIDLFMTFTGPDTLVVSESRNPRSPNHKPLNDLAKMLGNVQNANLNIVRVPMPDHSDGVFRSYTNVIYANGVLLVPSYSRDMDNEVRGIYQRLLPDWQIEFIDCNRLAAKCGALHCLAANLGNTPYTPMPVRNRMKVQHVSE